jgi:drug/metabolite transporter (DMT)-like permease
MNAIQISMLLGLSAIWGGSYLFMRIAAPDFGPVALVELRVVIGALVILPFTWRAGRGAELRRLLPRGFLLGAFATALPFALIAFAMLTLPAGLASVFNATAPLFGLIVGATVGLETLGLGRGLGILLGIVGVSLLAGSPELADDSATAFAIGAMLLASLSYGVAANYARAKFQGVEPLMVALVNQIAAAILLLPLLPFSLPDTMPGAGDWAAALTLAAVCTGLAYTLYFALIAQVGSTRALTVTFLMPIFGIVWGAMFLGEPITLHLIGGMAVVLLGTALTLGLHPPLPWRKQASAG